MPSATLHELIDAVRELFDHPPQRHALLQSPRWHPVWSAIDGLQLAQSAIDVYSISDNDLGNAESYLRLQGLLQSFYIQQCSCEEILKYLEISSSDTADRFAKLRQIRNDFTHPIQTHDGYSHTVPWLMLSQNQFSITSFVGDRSTTTHYKVAVLIAEQETGILNILDQIISFMTKADRAQSLDS